MTKPSSVYLAKGATIKSANGINAKAMLDADYATYWTTKRKDTTAIIEFDLKGRKTFDVLLLQESISVGQRIEKFVFEYHEAGEWKTITEGTTVGYKRLLRFIQVSAPQVRLRILSSRLNPTLAALGLYESSGYAAKEHQ